MEKILFVDDEKLLLEIYDGYANAQEYKVYTAQNGIDALDILENNRINVMFLDLKMPGMSGLELCKKIRENNPIALIYAITGFASLFELSDIREVGFDDYFKKPLNDKILLKTIDRSFKMLNRWSKNK